MSVQLIWATPDAEELMAYCARVSSPNQENPEYEKLLRYCIKNRHWSVFEMAHMCVEIITTRAISAQILRHRSFSFQEFSQRYSSKINIPRVNPRRQDTKNRQSSHDDLSPELLDWWAAKYSFITNMALSMYEQAVKEGIAKESARFLLPMSTETKMYMVGSVRSWIHYLEVRLKPDVQLEHREIAEGIWAIFMQQFPIIGRALGWREN